MTGQAEIAGLFQRIPFQAHTQLELLPDMRVRAPDVLELKNHLGTMHGGMLYALGEVSAAAAMASLLGTALFAITRHGEITYLKPARGAITGSASVALTREQILGALAVQRSLDVAVSVTLHDAASVAVATLSITFYVAPLR
jgi:acyl-coenzyme A thioesterase PaaI-like protein